MEDVKRDSGNYAENIGVNNAIGMTKSDIQKLGKLGYFNTLIVFLIEDESAFSSIALTIKKLPNE